MFKLFLAAGIGLAIGLMAADAKAAEIGRHEGFHLKAQYTQGARAETKSWAELPFDTALEGWGGGNVPQSAEAVVLNDEQKQTFEDVKKIVATYPAGHIQEIPADKTDAIVAAVVKLLSQKGVNPPAWFDASKVKHVVYITGLKGPVTVVVAFFDENDVMYANVNFNVFDFIDSILTPLGLDFVLNAD